MINKQLSVIIPVYNTPQKLLYRCLESVMNQSLDLSKIEIILVDDGSKQSYDSVIKHYSDYNVQLLRHDTNKGLVRARVTGMQHACGQYVAFLDSDDYVTCDFYRTLLEAAENSNADMVIGEFIFEYEDGRQAISDLMGLRHVDLDLKGNEIAELFLKQSGDDFSWHVVWNKVYRSDLIKRILPVALTVSERIVMCEDVLFSTLFYLNAKHLVNTHDDYYVYCRRSESSTISAELRTIQNSLRDIQKVFKIVRHYVGTIPSCKEFMPRIDRWQEQLCAIWVEHAEHSLKLSHEIEEVKKQASDIVGKVPAIDPDFNFFMHSETPLNLEQLFRVKERIKKSPARYASFDVFDTLVVRPFFWPTDLFCLLERIAADSKLINSELSFKDIRRECEQLARNELWASGVTRQEITLDEIYDVIHKYTDIHTHTLEKLKQLEVELELRYCVQRKTAKMLYDFVRALGKKVIVMSDMYLPKDVIVKILKNCGYNEIEHIFVSSNCGVTKFSGDLYRYVMRSLNAKGEDILHVGDNWETDVIKSHELGISSYHLPKTTDLLTNSNGGLYSGRYWSKMFGNLSPYNGDKDYGSVMRFFGMRCMLALVANKLFDNPFRPINFESDFGLNPRAIGYFGVGMNLYALTDFILGLNEKRHFSTIHFVARDGYLPMLAYQILAPDKSETQIDYLYASRKALAPLFIHNTNDLFFRYFNAKFWWKAATPEDFCLPFARMLSKNLQKTVPETLKNGEYLSKVPIVSLEQKYNFWKTFTQVRDNLSCFDEYRETFRRYAQEHFTENDAIVDIGYSGRGESFYNQIGFKVTPIYIHINDDGALERARENEFEILTLFSQSPRCTGVVREEVFSEIAPSCVGYERTGDSVRPVFEDDFDANFAAEFIIGAIQKSALQFCRDMRDVFAEHRKYLYYRYCDACIPWEYMLTYSPYKDRDILKACYFEDDMGIGRHKSMAELWKELAPLPDLTVQVRHQPWPDSVRSLILNTPSRLQRVVMMTLYDRNLLKEKVAKKLHRFSALLHLSKG